MDAGRSWNVDVADLEEPLFWGDDELTPEELARLNALEDDPVGAPPAGNGDGAPGDGAGDVASAVLAASGDPAGMSDAELIGSLARWHAVAARAQGRELRATAELLRRRRPRVWDRRADRAETRRDELDGATADEPERAMPAVVPSREAAEEIALALTVTGYAAGVQAQLAADLTQRLPEAFTELEAGRADLVKVKVLAEATQFLSDADAGKVDALLGPRLGEMTTGTLKDKARRAIIKVDPQAAERRKQRAERKARFVLYGNDDHTATVAVEKMPAQLAAAAKARVAAIARAARAAGMAGPIALLEAKVATGLLLDTLPLIPPPADGGPEEGGPNGNGRNPGGPGGPDDDGPDFGDSGGSNGDPGPAGEPWDGDWPTEWPGPEDPDPAGTGLAAFEPPDEPDEPDEPNESDEPDEPDVGPDFDPGTGPDSGGGEPRGGGADADGGRGPDRDTLPWPRIPVRASAVMGSTGLPPWLRPKAGGRIRLTVPWRTLAGTGPEPGELSWAGPITPAQARELAAAAADDPAAAWRLIVTDDDGRALAATPLPAPRGAGAGGPGLVGEVTITIQQSLAAFLAAGDVAGWVGRSLARLPGGEANLTESDRAALAGVLARALPAANRAAAEAAARAALDEQAGGCAHTMQAAGYRVPERLRRWLTVRDRTCRNPVCRQPAARCDQDHTRAYHRGGRTCSCNLGGLCRVHHQLKQLPGWRLTQDAHGFTWTTPAGLTYREQPHRYPV
jgi:hypothetical protein